MVGVLGLLILACMGISEGAKVCCGDLGCFSDDPPFENFQLPWCLDEIKPMFRLYTRANRNRFHLMGHGNPGATWRGSRRTHFIVHGWQASADMDWVTEMKDKLLDRGDFNVITVDWRGGSKTGINYFVGASNTRVMGAELNKFARGTLVQNGGHASRFYCIGHSLGAHLCGFFGQRMGKIGRITGMDPAGPNFYDQPINGRLSVASAALVDSIHTNGDCIGLCYGIGKPIGHVDFFPNGAGRQPGCITYLNNGTQLEKQEVDKHGNIVSCSHHRAVEYFIESIPARCKFTSNSCPRGKSDWNNDRCNTCAGDRCNWQGYDAEQRPGRGTFYLTTNSYRPFCIR